MEFKVSFGRFTFRNLNALPDEMSRLAFDRLMSHYEKQEDAGLLTDLSDYAVDVSVNSSLSFEDMADLSKFFTKAIENNSSISYFELHGILFYFCKDVTSTLNHLALGYFGIP